MRRRLGISLAMIGLTAAGVIAPLVSVRLPSSLTLDPSPLREAGGVRVALTWSTVGDALASHCVRDDGSDRLDVDVIAKCVRVNARGQSATGFDPTNLLRHEIENKQFSHVIAGAVTNNPFGRVVDFDASTRFSSVTFDGLEPDRGVFLTDSCAQGMVHPFQVAGRGNNPLISGGLICVGAGGGALQFNTAGTFIRDHKLIVGDLLSVVDDPYNQAPVAVIGAADITNHTVYNFFVWRRPGELGPARSELKGSFFRDNDCPSPGGTFALQSVVVCNDTSIQQASAEAGGTELEAGGLQCCSIVTVAVRWQVGGDLRSVDVTPPPGSTMTQRNRIDQGIFLVEQNGTFLMNLGTTDPMMGLMSASTYPTGRGQTLLGADHIVNLLLSFDASPGEATAVLTSMNSP